MVDTTLQGSFPFSGVQQHVLASSNDEIDAALQTLQARKDAWVALGIPERIALLDRLAREFAAVIPRLRDVELPVKGLDGDDFGIAQEWVYGFIVLRNLKSLRRSLADILEHGHPRLPGPVCALPNGQTAARIFPETASDRVIFPGYQMEVWMEPGVTPAGLPATQALAYRDKNRPGKVALVLGAGNVWAIPFSDVLNKLFVENQVVVLKMSPVNAHAGPIFEEGFRALVEAGFLRLVDGGPIEGSYLCTHPCVDTIHITGSDKTYETIVFGPGEEGQQRKTSRIPWLAKPLTAELGCITPAIIVPGRWSAREIDYQADKLTSWLANNSGYTCLTPHLVLTHAAWPQREQFLDAIRRKMAALALRKAYYPGAQFIHQRFLAAHPEAEQFGGPQEDQLPWTLIPSVSSQNPQDICFKNEAFCGILAEAPIPAESVPDFVAKAVDFANREVWGTLDAAIFVHPNSLKTPGVDAAVRRAVEDLRYGTVSVNLQTAVAFALAVAPWGSYPGQAIENPQSGFGWSHNTLMFSRPQKVVVRGPFMEFPRSPFLISRARAGRRLAQMLVDYTVEPSIQQLLRMVWIALRD